MARIKASKVTYQTKAEFEMAVDKLGALQLEIDADVAAFNLQKSEEDKRFKAQLKRKNERLSELLGACEMYVAHHRGELLGDRQTAETKLSDFGYQKSPGIVKTLNSKWTFAKAMVALKDAGMKVCVKVTEALDKNAVKKHVPEAEMAKYGLRMDYPEVFWVEAKRAADGTEKRMKGATK